MTPLCNCRSTLADYQPTEQKVDICLFCGYYVVWESDRPEPVEKEELEYPLHVDMPDDD